MEQNNQETNFCQTDSCRLCDCIMCRKYNWYQIIKVIVFVFLVIFIGQVIFGQNKNRQDFGIINTITVSGKGEIMAKPDIATVSFGVVKQGVDVATAQKDSSTKMTAVLEVLKENGVEDKDIKTTSYNIYPKYEYHNFTTYPYGRQIIVGYEVSQTVFVKIRDLEKSGSILSGVGSAGATNISGLTFTIDNEDEMKNTARDLAIKEAKDQAKILAKELGVKLVGITSFSENGDYPIYYGMEKSSAVLGMGGDRAMPAIPTGENTITSQVHITYEIK